MVDNNLKNKTTGSHFEGVWSQLINPDALEWNRVLLNQGVKGSFFQTTHYSEFKRVFSSEVPFYLRQFDLSGAIIAQAVVRLTHPYEWGFERRKLTKVNPIARKFIPILLCSQAPTVMAVAQTVDYYKSIAQWMADKGNELGCLFARLVPSYYQDSYAENRGEIRSTLERIGYYPKHKATLLVDLQQDEETLFANLKKEARNKVRKAEKQGVKIIEIGTEDDDLLQLQEIIEQTARRNGVPSTTFNKLKETFLWYSDNCDGFMRAFISYHNGNLVSSQKALIFNGNITLGGVSYTDYSRKYRIYGNDLMQWHMIKWGREQGFSTLDLTGIEPFPSSPKMRSIYEFKSKWGGKQIDYDEFTIYPNNLKSRLHRYLTENIGPNLKAIDRSVREVK